MKTETETYPISIHIDPRTRAILLRRRESVLVPEPVVIPRIHVPVRVRDGYDRECLFASESVESQNAVMHEVESLPYEAPAVAKELNGGG